MSAPAMKPEGLPERIITPLGGAALSSRSSVSSSSRTAWLSELTLLPGRSMIRLTIPSLSRSSRHALLFMRLPSLLANFKIADQRAVVRVADFRDAKAGDVDTGADQNEIKLHPGGARRVGGQSLRVGAAQSRGSHKQV